MSRIALLLIAALSAGCADAILSIDSFRTQRPRLMMLPVVSATFQEIRDGRPKTIGFLVKKARGLMARFVIQNRVDDPEGLKEFSAEGYGFRPDLSDERKLVFTR